MHDWPLISHSIEETETAAESFGIDLRGGEVLILSGPLGSGKTAFVRGLARGLDVDDPDGVSSPSYTIVNEYPGPLTLIHVDLYRLMDNEDIEDLALEDLLGANIVMVVEWGERIPPGIRSTHRFIFEIVDDEKRRIELDQET
jgi:tRNA threonylcarbamoyladenosine biosynthesis protein TsaE